MLLYAHLRENLVSTRSGSVYLDTSVFREMDIYTVNNRISCKGISTGPQFGRDERTASAPWVGSSLSTSAWASSARRNDGDKE